MSKKRSFFLAGFTLAISSLFGAEPQAIVPEKHLDLLDTYCMDCHDADTQKGKVNLEDLPLEVNTLQQAELWQKVLDAMNSGEMPPEKKRQPERVEKADFLEDLAKTMAALDKALGRVESLMDVLRRGPRRFRRREEDETVTVGEE